MDFIVFDKNNYTDILWRCVVTTTYRDEGYTISKLLNYITVKSWLTKLSLIDSVAQLVSIYSYIKSNVPNEIKCYV